jgi:hypothetical protein
MRITMKNGLKVLTRGQNHPMITTSFHMAQFSHFEKVPIFMVKNKNKKLKF